MKVELKVREGGVVSPARRQLLSALRQTLSTMSVYCVKLPLKVRADAALSPIYASYKELQSDWRWIHSMDPEAAAAADQWVKEHPEQWKELEHMLYYSEANFHKHVAPDTLEDADIKQPRSYNPEAFLPEKVRNAIYDDMR